MKLTIAETSPPASGKVTDPLSDPNHPAGFTLPTAVTSLDPRTGARSTAKVTWNPVDPTSHATPGIFTVLGTAALTNPGSGKGAPMTAVKATVDVTRPRTTSTAPRARR